MRLSDLLVPTLREDPVESEIASHRLILRAGLMRQLMSGVYITLPMGLRVLRRIEAIVREEMDASGAQEIRMPIVLPAEPWKQTGRYDLYGDTLFKLTDRHDREMVLGPTQEEVVTPLVAGSLPSYKDLPANLYQIEWKYRDEFRPRFGLLRGREFYMKDAYSFDRDEAGLHASYQVMFEAYERIFATCGMDLVVVEADPGQIGGGINHEFMARADVGEDLFVECEKGDYLADVEAARTMAPESVGPGETALSKVHTPGKATIDEVSTFLEVAPTALLKTMMFDAGGTTIVVLIPGDREVSQEKLERIMFPAPVRPLDDSDFRERGFVKGFVGPVGLDATILADHGVAGGNDWVVGANEVDHHSTGANVGRDFQVDRYEDLVTFKEGDRCPNCAGELRVGRSIVVGHIYQIGTKYSVPLEATFQDEDGAAKPYVMGCYGIGISRIIAAAVEQHHDDAGIMWPKAIAPFDVVIVLATRDHEESVATSKRLYEELRAAGLDVALDDRDAAAGVKFNDADLIGYPVQVVVGKRGVEGGELDVKIRATGERRTVSLDAAVEGVIAALREAP